MKIDILASGSSGNCIAIRSVNTTILIDAGIAKTKIEKRLMEVGIRPDEIEGIFITHAHKDHVKGLPFANKYRIPVYASEGEWRDITSVDDDLRRVIDEHHCGYELTAFKTHHDAYEPIGLAFTFYGNTAAEDCKISICLDTGHVDREILEAMKDSDIYIIEANHDPDMVAASDYPDSVKARILSEVGHLSNRQAAYALKRLVQGRGERIYLTHLSSNNNMPTLARMTVEAALRVKGLANGKHYFLEVV